MKSTTLSIGIAVLLVAGALVMVRNGDTDVSQGGAQAVSIVDGVQIIEMQAKGGYQPRSVVAQAGIPTVLKMKTNGTFDCSSAIQIPSLQYSAHLPASGETIIDIPPQDAGVTIDGTCAMGMYSFYISFR